MKLRTLIAAVLVASACTVPATAQAASAATAQDQVSAIGTYHPMVSTRILDTRHGIGAPTEPIGPGKSLDVAVTGQGNVPGNDVSAVVLTLTETDATRGGYLTVYPFGSPMPTVSNLNYVAHQTRANEVTVPVLQGGITIFNSGRADVIADVSGYFVGNDAAATGGEYFAVNPIRLLDTRSDTIVHRLNPGQDVAVNVLTGQDLHVTALAVNITAVNASAAGYLTAWNGRDLKPNASALNFAAGSTVPNLAIVPAVFCGGLCGLPDGGGFAKQITIANDSTTAKVDLIVDLLGYFDDGTLGDGMRFDPITPTRIIDSRYGQGLPGPLAAGKTHAATAPATVVDSLTGALAMNVTAVAPTKSTYMTLWPDGVVRPTASTLNPAAHQTVANAAITTLPLSGSGRFDVYNNAGTTDFLADVAGRYEYDTAPSGPPAEPIPWGSFYQ